MHNTKNKFVIIVYVTDSKQVTLAKRSLPIQPMARCFCLWQCACECIGAFARTDASDMCETMPKSEATTAGFTFPQNENNEIFNWFAVFPIFATLLLLLLVFGKLCTLNYLLN